MQGNPNSAVHYALTYHRPSFHAIFDHQVLGNLSGDGVHVVAIGFFRHTRLAVSKYGDAQIAARWQTCVGHCA